jgi:outer membrane protein TolC
LSLEEALGMAIPASEALELAQTAVRRARGEQTRAGAERWPQLTASLGYSRLLRSQFEDFSFGGEEDSTSDGFETLPFGRKNTYNVGVGLQWSLFTGGRIAGQRQAADAAERGAALGLTSSQALVTLEVVRTYYDAVAADLRVRIAELALEQADSTVGFTERRRAAGTQPEFDLLRARVSRSNTWTAVIVARTQRDVSYLSLQRLVGLSLGQPIRLTTAIADSVLQETPTLALILASPLDTAVGQRVVVRQATEAVTAQEGLLKAAGSQVWPQVVLTSQYGRIGYPSNYDPFAPRFLTNWNVAAGLEFPIYTGGRIGGDKAVARSGLDEARLRLRELQELAEVDTRAALAELAAAEAAWEASGGTIGEATRAYQIAELRFREGISTQTELLDARSALVIAELTRLEAARSLGVARVRVALLPSLPVAGATPVQTSSAGTRAAAPVRQATPITTTALPGVGTTP